MRRPGIVYVLASYRPNVVKVGHTHRTVAGRIVSLCSTSGYRAFGPYTVVLALRVPDARLVERLAHMRLARFRMRLTITGRREMFGCSPDVAVAAVHWAAPANPCPSRRAEPAPQARSKAK